MNSLPQDPVYHFLREQFRASTRRVLVASVLSTAGCTYSDPASEATSESSSETLIGTALALTQLTSKPTCDSGQWRPLKATAPTITPNHLSWRRGAAAYDEAGVRCEGAADPRVCEAHVRSVEVHQAPSDWYVLSTTGDQIDLWSDAGLLDLLGDIDTADEALMVAAAGGYPVACYGDPNDGDPNATQLNTLADSTGYEVWLSPSLDTCGTVSRYRLHVSFTGQVAQLSVDTQYLDCPAPSVGTAMPGRRPPGLMASPPARDRANSVGKQLARDAHFEAASVPAFEILAQELTLHGAPASLRGRALSAAQDEVRHARQMSDLAAQFETPTAPAELSSTRCRSRADVIVDNAVEGCVGETYAALVATFQAARVRDPRIRRVLEGIAKDETEHAAFSWTLHQWATRAMGDVSRQRIRNIQRAALRRLHRSAKDPHPEAARTLGLPSAQQQRRLLDDLGRTLLSSSAPTIAHQVGC